MFCQVKSVENEFDFVCFFLKVATLPDEFPDAHSIINDLRVEYVVVVEGVVRSRPVESVNKKMATGSIEVILAGLHFLCSYCLA